MRCLCQLRHEKLKVFHVAALDLCHTDQRRKRCGKTFLSQIKRYRFSFWYEQLYNCIAVETPAKFVHLIDTLHCIN